MTRVNFFSLLLIISAIMFLPVTTKAQVTIGSAYDPQPFSVLELISNNERGFRLPQLNLEQRIALTATLPPLDANGLSPAMGLQIFNTCNQCVETWNGEDWISLCEGDPAPFIPPPHFDANCRDNPVLANCFAELRRFPAGVTRLADVTNPGYHEENARSFSVGGVAFNMMPVTGGVFYMGERAAASGHPNPDPNAAAVANGPVHQVGVSSFYIGQHEVTHGLFDAVMRFEGVVSGTTLENVWVARNNPTTADTDPVTANHAQNNVSWYDAIVFMNRLSVITGRTPVYSCGEGSLDLLNTVSRPIDSDALWNAIVQNRSANGFRLPTESEWEYAARGGQMNEYTRSLGASGVQYRFSGSNNVDSVAWHSGNRPSDGVQPVGGLASNDLGIYDMSGNVWEWVWDRWRSGYDPCCAVNPTGVETGSNRVLRGGSWLVTNTSSRVSIRGNNSPASDNPNGTRIWGFRIAVSAP